MSKGTRISFFITIVLIIGCLVYAGRLFTNNQQLKQTTLQLQGDLEQAQTREQKYLTDIAASKTKLEEAEAQRANFEQKFTAAESRANDLLAKVDALTADRDQWQQKVQDITQARDDLMGKLETLRQEKEQIQEELTVLKEQHAAAGTDRQGSGVSSAGQATPSVIGGSSKSSYVTDYGEYEEGSSENEEQNEEHWAAVLKEKAELEVKMDELETELADQKVSMAEIKQKSADLEIELDMIKQEKEEVQRELKYKGEIVNNLSLELARTKNDKKMVADRLTGINNENRDLRREMKRLVASKGALEKSLVRLTEDRNTIEKKLLTTESVVQNKIDEIWEIKESLDRSFQAAKIAPARNEVELPPIVVSSQGPAVNFGADLSKPGLNGKVISVNEQNNFVVVDIGESSGLQLNDTLSVYRDSKYIARLHVIQLRKDIAAADIKDQWAKVQVGDIIR